MIRRKYKYPAEAPKHKDIYYMYLPRYAQAYLYKKIIAHRGFLSNYVSYHADHYFNQHGDSYIGVPRPATSAYLSQPRVRIHHEYLAFMNAFNCPFINSPYPSTSSSDILTMKTMAGRDSYTRITRMCVLIMISQNSSLVSIRSSYDNDHVDIYHKYLLTIK